MKHSCDNCRFYNLNKKVPDERGKHECYGYSLLSCPIVLGYEIDKENNCEKFKEKDGTSIRKIKKEWYSRPFIDDKSMDILTQNLIRYRKG